MQFQFSSLSFRMICSFHEHSTRPMTDGFLPGYYCCWRLFQQTIGYLLCLYIQEVEFHALSDIPLKIQSLAGR